MKHPTQTRSMGRSRLAFALALFLAASLGAEAIKRFESQPGSKLKIDGTSTMHDWTVEGQIIGGYMELNDKTQIDPSQPGISGLDAGKLEAKVEVSIPVRSLKSGKSLMDDVMHNAMKMQEHPQIKYRLREMRLKEGPHAAGSPFVFNTTGELTVAGVTRTNQMDVQIDRTGVNRLRASGTTTVKMTDFGIQPPAPKIALGAIKTGDDVKISFEWLTAEKAPAPKPEPK